MFFLLDSCRNVFRQIRHVVNELIYDWIDTAPGLKIWRSHLYEEHSFKVLGRNFTLDFPDKWCHARVFSHILPRYSAPAQYGFALRCTEAPSGGGSSFLLRILVSRETAALGKISDSIDCAGIDIGEPNHEGRQGGSMPDIQFSSVDLIDIAHHKPKHVPDIISEGD